MSTAPTVEQFLAMQDTEDDNDEAHAASFEHQDPLESIAESLSRIAECMGGQTLTAELVQQENEDQDDWEAKHQELYLLVAEIEKIVSKSTSKVSLEVKAAIDRWKSPEIPKALTADEVATGQQEGPVPASNATEMGLPQPEHGAPVEEWRAYARQLGHGRTGPAFNELEQKNRSQIRTMLGIEQPSVGA